MLHVKGLVICFYLGWSGSILEIRTNIIKVGSKSWLLTCSSNITLSLPSYVYTLFLLCNGYLSLLYFCLQLYGICSDFNASLLRFWPHCTAKKTIWRWREMIKNYFMISFLTFPRTYLAWCIENAKIIKIKLLIIKFCSGLFFIKQKPNY